MRVYSDNARMKSKRGKNKKVHYKPLASSATDVVTDVVRGIAITNLRFTRRSFVRPFIPSFVRSSVRSFVCSFSNPFSYSYLVRMRSSVFQNLLYFIFFCNLYFQQL